MLPGEIHGDASFTAFQAKLATVVVNAEALGKRVGATCCPLGAHPESVCDVPPSSLAQRHGWMEVDREDLVAFINGWHGMLGQVEGVGFVGPYAELGAAYRSLFIRPSAA